MLAAQIWTYWISIFLVVGVVLAIIAFFVGYLVKVTSRKYPRQ